MIQELLDIYDNAAARNKLWQKKGTQLWFIIIWVVCFSGTSWFVISANASIKPDSWWFAPLPMFHFLVFFLILMLYICIQIKSKPSYEMIRAERIEKLTEHIIKSNWDEKKLDMIQALIQTTAGKTKLSTVIFGSVFSLLFVPLWSAYLDKIFECFNDSWHLLNSLFIGLLIPVTGLAIFLVSVEFFKNDVLTKYGTMERLNELITEIRISGFTRISNGDMKHG